MFKMNKLISTLIIALLMVFSTSVSNAAEKYPTVTLAWSEYPSWSAIEVASALKYINGKEGKYGPIEHKWKVDIVLNLMDYDSCLVAYSAFRSDFICVTNMDILNPALSRNSVAILPTSRSHGGDALIVSSNIASIEDLVNHEVFGLEATVSEYAFDQIITSRGGNPNDYSFVNMDPGAAAISMQQKKKGYDAIMVWNPFIVNTLEKRPDVRVLFSSESIPGQIIDMVVGAESTLKTPHGKAGACAIADAFYQVSANLQGSDTELTNETIIAIGEKFSNLKLQPMRKVLKQTQFYHTPEVGMELFSSPEFKETMNTVTNFCSEKEYIDSEVNIHYGSEATSDANLTFSTSYMQLVKETQ
jgi:ABC-type nitrate/sulfonate/bicarbonate transport system substrate-binding protein